MDEWMDGQSVRETERQTEPGSASDRQIEIAKGRERDRETAKKTRMSEREREERALGEYRGWKGGVGGER